MAAALLAHHTARVGPLNTVQEFPREKRRHSPQQAEERKERALNRTAPDYSVPCPALPSFASLWPGPQLVRVPEISEDVR